MNLQLLLTPWQFYLIKLLASVLNTWTINERVVTNHNCYTFSQDNFSELPITSILLTKYPSPISDFSFQAHQGCKNNFHFPTKCPRPLCEHYSFPVSQGCNTVWHYIELFPYINVTWAIYTAAAYPSKSVKLLTENSAIHPLHHHCIISAICFYLLQHLINVMQTWVTLFTYIAVICHFHCTSPILVFSGY